MKKGSVYSKKHWEVRQQIMCPSRSVHACEIFMCYFFMVKNICLLFISIMTIPRVWRELNHLQQIFISIILGTLCNNHVISAEKAPRMSRWEVQRVWATCLLLQSWKEKEHGIAATACRVRPDAVFAARCHHYLGLGVSAGRWEWGLQQQHLPCLHKASHALAGRALIEQYCQSCEYLDTACFCYMQC